MTSLITPTRAAELLALLPEDANFAAIGDSELYLCWPDPESNWPPGVGSRTVAELEPEDAALPVLAETTDALRTVLHLHGLLDALSKEYDDLRLRHANLSQHNHEIHGKLAHMAKKDGSPALKSLVMNMKATPKSEVLSQIPSAASVLKARGGITVQARGL